MGIVVKQSISGTIWSYAGVAVGLVTTALLYPHFLTTEQVGMLSLVLSYSMIYSQFSSLGIPAMTSKMFSHFRDNNTKHHGYSFLLILLLLLGSVLFLVVFFLMKQWLVNDKEALFASNIWSIIPITIFTMVFSSLDAYNKMLYNAVLGTFLQEFLQRVLILVAIVLYGFNFINFEQCLLLYVFALCSKGLIIAIYLICKREMSIKIDWRFFSPQLKKEMLSVSLYFLLGGLGGALMLNVDKIIIGKLLNLSNVGVYTIAFFFGTLVVIPSRAITKISSTFIADAWKENNLQEIKNIYAKTCANQALIGMFIFVGLCLNLDNVLALLGSDYSNSKWVILIIGFAFLSDMIAGTSPQILAFSNYYKLESLSVIATILIEIVLLYIFVPVYGIVGAAISMAIVFFLRNVFRFLFIFLKFEMQPYTFSTLFTALFFIIAYVLISLIPDMPLVLDILARSILLAILTAVFAWFTPIGKDIRAFICKAILRK